MAELDRITLRDPSSALTATFVPGAGMIGTSLADDGVEFLGQRRGLQAYLTDGKTMGIPILYPWANRLSGTEYRVDTTTVELAGAPGVRTDPHGAPMHGVLAAYPGWQVTEESAHSLTATVDFDTPELLAAFPFPHVLTQRITLSDRTLSIATTVQPGAGPVPLCFGYHPYFTLPDVPRAQWELSTPAMRHLPVDDRGIPTGAHQPWAADSGALGERVLDDGFDRVADGAVFALSAGGRRIEITFDEGYPAAQLFAPSGDALVAIEPMTAPTDALRRGGYRTATGEPMTARFSIRIG
ncbi:aldose epimerase [Mycobacterium adipatum]|jgi:aldose 1-epimerase|uniref:Aldose epimerase n=1 Tax=Mycobacterium adipatum TaxID=1682113 RepID=A0A172UTG0_9MYCO|nr:aldose 1-epimerase [Mycobacterium adipatum]ANE82492.1 aldose epimerase [Mycobacterium adipatum]MBI5737377.1 aldose 1-epimerase [Mycolicibacterium neoaurum]